MRQSGVICMNDQSFGFKRGCRDFCQTVYFLILPFNFLLLPFYFVLYPLSDDQFFYTNASFAMRTIKIETIFKTIETMIYRIFALTTNWVLYQISECKLFEAFNFNIDTSSQLMLAKSSAYYDCCCYLAILQTIRLAIFEICLVKIRIS
jgi:hypothetical protein